MRHRLQSVRWVSLHCGLAIDVDFFTATIQQFRNGKKNPRKVDTPHMDLPPYSPKLRLFCINSKINRLSLGASHGHYIVYNSTFLVHSDQSLLTNVMV